MHQKLLYISLQLLFLGYSLPLSAQTLTFSLEVTDTPLETVITSLEQQYDLLFSYKQEDIEGIRITAEIAPTTLTNFLERLLEDTGLEFKVLDGNYVILKKMPPKPEPLLPRFCGTVVDSMLGEPLPYASVYISRTMQGNTTNEAGRFDFRTACEPADTLIVSYIGYEKKTFLARDILGNPCDTISLHYVALQEESVLITEYLADGIELGEKGASTILRPLKIRALPGQIEPDILRSVQFLPGMSSPTGGANTISIRGGAPDQNLVLWENIPIYHTAHYFGMISAFNPYIIDRAKIYRGGFGAEYGGRVSGVIDLQTEDYRNPNSSFSAGSNFLNAYVNGRASLARHKASVVYSLRRSISELWRSPTFNNITLRNQQGELLGYLPGTNTPPGIEITDQFNFLDANLKGSAQVTNRDEVSIAWFYGRNNFDNVVNNAERKMTQDDLLTLDNQGLSASWTHTWQEGLTSQLTGLTTNYAYTYDYFIDRWNPNRSDKFGVKNNHVQDQQLQFTTHYQTPQHHQLTLGYQFHSYTLSHEITRESQETVIVSETDTASSHLQVLHASFKTAPDKKMGIDAGVRWTHFQRTDSSYVEPRLRFWYNPTNAFTVHANVGKYHQFVSQLLEFRGLRAGIETPVWVLSGSPQAPVLSASQWQLGIIYHQSGWVVDLQGYLKNVQGLTSLASGFEVAPKDPFIRGTSSIRGVDLLIKKRWNNFRSWVSYSISKADYHFAQFFDPNFPTPYDQRHSLNLANLLETGNFEFSIGWRLASGLAYSEVKSYKIELNRMGKEVVLPKFDGYNNERLPLQHQLNASAMYHFRLQQKGSGRGVIGLSLFNIYQHTNFYARDFFIENRRNSDPEILYIDRVDLGFTPNAVLRFEW